MKVRSDSYYTQSPTSFEIQGSNDSLIYTTLKAVTTGWTQGEEKNIIFFNEIPFLYYRIFIKP
ncbi:hypothetical protein FACS1894122_10900 [Alphaproteobacteria bacterium]|nr:hypothetical protein FACS1894122_10900 [Alphaproteobacteria bacterium]